MRRILIFSGTSDGRQLAETLAAAGVPGLVCVATEYGREVMPTLSGMEVRQGRMDRAQIRQFLAGEDFLALVDATHPFAVVVSENLRACADEAGLPYLRLQRASEGIGDDGDGVSLFSTPEECRAALERTQGNVLLTTGSKDLATYCDSEAMRERLFVRVLPSEESIGLARAQGLSGKQIIAMQGPFSREMNVALLRQCHASYMVTKESGSAGGFPEKVAAAKEAGVGLFVIGNPERQEGWDIQTLCQKLTELTGISIHAPALPSFCISLVGIGMGNLDTLTVKGKELIGEADGLFGAERLLACVEAWGIGNPKALRFPYYLAKDVIPELERMEETGATRAVLLFSGDSGFYSGCQNMIRQLKEWKESRDREISVQVYPGISCVSQFAASCGLSWNDGRILSIHGKGDRSQWETELLGALKRERKLFLLVSGVEDVRTVGAILEESGLRNRRILVGRQLSYEEESIREYTAEECQQLTRQGLYVMAILCDHPEPRRLCPQRKDSDFLRGKVPMTKEEVRQLVVCKLHLTDQSMVYDVGSGTGSVAMEIASQSDGIMVYAIEQREEGIELIRRNAEQFQLTNVIPVPGRAPECLASLPVPTHAFLGGTGGDLREILAVLYKKNPTMRVVLTTVTMETLSLLTSLRTQFPIEDQELIQVQVSREKELGSYHLMQAENPIFLFSFQFGSGE